MFYNLLYYFNYINYKYINKKNWEFFTVVLSDKNSEYFIKVIEECKKVIDC